IIVERYDSTGAYNKFYAVSTQNGFLMYTLHNNYMLFMIELNEDVDSGERSMHVNYYVNYSALDREKIIGNENFIKFISSIAYYFSIDRIILWADYKACDLDYSLTSVDSTSVASTSVDSINETMSGGAKQRGFAGKVYKGSTIDKFKEEPSKKKYL